MLNKMLLKLRIWIVEARLNAVVEHEHMHRSSAEYARCCTIPKLERELRELQIAEWVGDRLGVK
jgi:hypothetical protein